MQEVSCTVAAVQLTPRESLTAKWGFCGNFVWQDFFPVFLVTFLSWNITTVLQTLCQFVLAEFVPRFAT